MKQLRQHSSTLTLIGFLAVQVVALVWTTRGTYGVDFAAYYLAGRALQQGRNIYTLTDADWNALAAEANVPEVEPPYRYPPLIVGVLRPIALLPFTIALAIWRILTILALLLTALCLSQFLRQRWIDPLIFAAAAFFVPEITTLYAGQANTFVLAALTLYLLLDQRRHARWAGLALAFSILIKPLSIALAVLLVWRRDWRRLGYFLTGLVIAVAIMMVLVGLQPNLDYIRNVNEVTPLGTGPYPPNQSIWAFFSRLLTAHEFGPALTDQPMLATVLSLITAGGLALGVAFLTWPQHRPNLFALEVGLVLVAFSLVMPLTWYHHTVLALIPWLLAWYTKPSRLFRMALIVAYGFIRYIWVADYIQRDRQMLMVSRIKTTCWGIATNRLTHSRFVI